jgi:hypothetical protein
MDVKRITVSATLTTHTDTANFGCEEEREIKRGFIFWKAGLLWAKMDAFLTISTAQFDDGSGGGSCAPASVNYIGGGCGQTD